MENSQSSGRSVTRTQMLCTNFFPVESVASAFKRTDVVHDRIMNQCQGLIQILQTLGILGCRSVGQSDSTSKLTLTSSKMGLALFLLGLALTPLRSLQRLGLAL